MFARSYSGNLLTKRPFDQKTTRLTDYFVSRCFWCLWHRGQYFINSRRAWVFFRFFSVVYVRSLHSVQASVTMIRFAFFGAAISHIPSIDV